MNCLSGSIRTWILSGNQPSPSLSTSLRDFLEYIDKWDEYSKLIEKYKKNNHPIKRKRNVPSDEEIEHIFEIGFIPTKDTKFSRKLASSWQFVYGLLAVYGLRIHEVWHIANWENPVVLKNGDWVEIEEFTDNIEDIENENIKSEKIQLQGKTIYPAILDENNKNKILAIKHQTKTGHRLAAPLSPVGKDWFKQFGLNQPWNAPIIKDPLGKPGENGQGYNCSNRACRWFRERKYGFTPHSLRYAWNHTGHAQGIPIGALAESLGHSILMNTTTYYAAMSIDKKHKVISPILDKANNEQSELEKLKEELKQKDIEIVQLKTALQFKDEEIERLRTELMMMKAIEN